MPPYPHILIFACVMLLNGAARASDPAAVTNIPPSAQSGFEAFRIVLERNIFNQNRSARLAQRETQRTPPPVVQLLSLVGTMSYEKGDLAFFDGSKPEFRKPVKAGEKIAGYEVKEITPSCVKIGNEAQQFELKVGQQLRKKNDGDWQISTSREPIPANLGEAAVSGSTSSEATSSGAGASEEEALKRLMEKRAKEINQ